MAKHYLDFDPESCVAHWLDIDDSTDIATYGVDQNVTSMLEANKAEYNADHPGWGDGKLVASIPMALYSEWVRDGRDKDQAFLKRWLNDPENRYFRTRPGTI